MGIGFVLSGMFCFFVAHLADKYSKMLIADVTIISGILIITLSFLF